MFSTELLLLIPLIFLQVFYEYFIYCCSVSLVFVNFTLIIHTDIDLLSILILITTIIVIFQYESKKEYCSIDMIQLLFCFLFNIDLLCRIYKKMTGDDLR